MEYNFLNKLAIGKDHSENNFKDCQLNVNT